MDMEALERLADSLWSPWLLGAFLLFGGFCTVKTGLFPLMGVRKWLMGTVGGLFRRDKGVLGAQKGGLTQFQAMSTALAATIGTGSIAGVATAITMGGPGAVFWMWITGLVGMATGFVEKTLAVKYHRRAPDGGWQGGPMEYMERGVKSKVLAVLYAAACLIASIAGGNLVQANSIAASLHHAFGWEPMAVGIVTALLTGVVVLGGLGRIGRVTERLVPVMALLFLAGGGVCVVCKGNMLAGAFREIWVGAFTPPAAVGGVTGAGLSAALRYGVARGVFTNEAGLGTSAMAHGAAEARHPVEQGFWGIFEVFLSTMVVCTVTALVILTSGVYAPGDALTGAGLSGAAFSATLGGFGEPFLAVCVLLFAFSSLLGWCYYGERCLGYLAGNDRLRPGYRLLFFMCILWGSLGEVGQVWALADLCNALMALPNLAALLLLSPEAFALLKEWKGAKKGPA